MVDRSNPSDKYGSVSRQSKVIAVVVDDRDPKESGRFKCRILGDQDDTGKIPDDKLAWYACTSSGSAQMRGYGSFPPQYTVGSRVILENMDQQGFYVMGSAPNTLTDKSKEDRHTESTKTTPEKQFKIPGVPSWYTLFDGAKHLDELERTTEQALRIANGLTSSLRQNTQNKKKDIGADPTKPAYLGQGPVQWLSDMRAPQTIGTIKAMAGTNAQQFIQGALGSQLGVMVPKSLEIVESLKKTASQGLNIPGIQAIGGMGNLMGAIQGIMSFLKQQSKNDSEPNEIINELYRIYKEETGLNALDNNGEETELYKAWEILYLAREVQAQLEEEDVIS